MKTTLPVGDKRRLDIIRLILAAIKQREVGERIALGDTQILAVLDKLVKQRRDAIKQYTKAKRQDLAEQEAYEVGVCREYLPAALDEDELVVAPIDEAIAAVAAASVKDIGKKSWVGPNSRPRVGRTWAPSTDWSRNASRASSYSRRVPRRRCTNGSELG